MPAKSKSQQKAAGARACGQAGRHQEKRASGRVPQHGKLHVRKGIEGPCLDQAQGQARTQKRIRSVGHVSQTQRNHDSLAAVEVLHPVKAGWKHSSRTCCHQRLGRRLRMSRWLPRVDGFGCQATSTARRNRRLPRSPCRSTASKKSTTRSRSAEARNVKIIFEGTAAQRCVSSSAYWRCPSGSPIGAVKTYK